MMFNYSMRTIAFLCFIAPFYCLGQLEYQDFGSWLRTDFEYGLSKKIDFSARFEMRTIENSSRIKQVFSQYSAKVKINKHVNTSFALRTKVINAEFGEVFQSFRKSTASTLHQILNR